MPMPAAAYGIAVSKPMVIGLVMPVFWTLPPAFLSGTAAAGGIALINSIGNLGGIISPYLVGKVVDITGVPSGGLYAVAAVLILAALLILFGLPARIANRDQAL